MTATTPAPRNLTGLEASLDEFEHRVDELLRKHFSPVTPRTAWGEGPDTLVSAGLTSEEEDPDDLARARQFQALLHANGLAWISGPVDLGGSGLTRAHEAVYRRVARRYDVPDTSVFMIGQRIVAPAIDQFGTEAQRAHWLPAIWSGHSIACQIFSEPDAGSDLASLRCRARPDGDGWRISGQKVWSSGAHVSEVGELLVRTEDDESLRHRGVTMFLLDMGAPGVTVKPLRQMNGNSHFNEVFLDDVYIPDSDRLGPRGGGWAVANASLSSERDLAIDEAGLYVDPVPRLLELARHLGRQDDPIVRQRLADAVARDRIGRWLLQSLPASPSGGATVAASLTKLYESWSMWTLAHDAAALLGPDVTADSGRWGRYCWSDVVLSVQSQRIAGGTDEIQRNIIAERGLGLPREPITPKGASS